MYEMRSLPAYLETQYLPKTCYIVCNVTSMDMARHQLPQAAIRTRSITTTELGAVLPNRAT